MPGATRPILWHYVLFGSGRTREFAPQLSNFAQRCPRIRDAVFNRNRPQFLLPIERTELQKQRIESLVAHPFKIWRVVRAAAGVRPLCGRLRFTAIDGVGAK